MTKAFASMRVRTPLSRASNGTSLQSGVQWGRLGWRGAADRAAGRPQQPSRRHRRLGVANWTTCKTPYLGRTARQANLRGLPLGLN